MQLAMQHTALRSGRGFASAAVALAFVLPGGSEAAVSATVRSVDEHVIVSLLLFMINNRMVVAGPLYQDEAGEDIWGEPGAAAMTGPLDPGISEEELDSARGLGERLARLAKKLRGQ